MPWRKKLIGEILVEKGLLSLEHLTLALGEQALTKEFLGSILVKRKWIKEKDLLGALSDQYNLQVVDLKTRYIDWTIVKNFSASLIMDHHCFPVERDDFSVTFAILNPLDAWAIKKAEEEAKGLKVKLVLTTQGDMEDAVKRYRAYIQQNVPKLLD